ncbi:helix-turn-helix domain-containing protein [Paucibacter sp. Y2R2-4]|uniref:helix-turn-helix domain-containing protein n=1 Tax=Paucibacter sp. Y2R2-4 TaxID=2893553 RepID=UPI0021E3CC1B|nr:AraC family transcriptional regulator [Paucibacter sp. Y2R2-4]MCV2350900.1 AraC family transcriptional regulator [Paucibacter sp. Y2R2-4]
MNSSDTARSRTLRPALASPTVSFESREAIEAYLDGLNQRSPLARRNIRSWGASPSAHLRLGLMPMPSGKADGSSVFLTESQNSFVLDVQAQPSLALGAPLLLGLVLAGSVSLRQGGLDYVAQAGEGVLISPAEVERAQFSANSHFVELALPRSHLLRVGAELRPGQCSGLPAFKPLLAPPLAQGLLFMAQQAARLLPPPQSAVAVPPMFERCLEMMALSLVQEQQLMDAPTRSMAALAPRSVHRAIEYIDAHAQRDILLADIAEAACVSVSSLLRHFQAHLGQSPMAFLRQLRLDRARLELRQGRAGSIRELAQRWGFQSAGKFSQAYLRRFGERPSEGRKARP